MTAHETLEQAKHYGEFVTGIARPKARVLDGLIRARKANLHHFADDGETPNSTLPLIHYRTPIRLRSDYDPAAIIERVFGSNKWGYSWRDGVYPFNHFHTRIHEVLGIARGRVTILFGGANGKFIDLKAGDVVVIPAGVGHRRRKASTDLLVVGAYPSFGHYDEPRPADVEIDAARKSIAAVKRPFTDPVYGKKGPLLEAWRGAHS
ncbi:MAG: hypothetical protein WAU68_05050 [Vitreimonas sp.]